MSRFNTTKITEDDEIFQTIVMTIEKELTQKDQLRPGIKDLIIRKWWSHMSQDGKLVFDEYQVDKEMDFAIDED